MDTHTVTHAQAYSHTRLHKQMQRHTNTYTVEALFKLSLHGTCLLCKRRALIDQALIAIEAIVEKQPTKHPSMVS